MDRLSRWRELVGRPDEAIPLDEAALVIAAQADASLDVPAQLARLDALAAQIERADTAGVCQFVFETLAVRGDTRTYDDPRNSYLDQILERRLGIPISLSVLLIEIARRCGVRLEGVGMPGHFLVRDPRRPELFIDAFSGGRLLDRAACSQLLNAMTRQEADLPAHFLATVGTRSILTRMLANLDHSFRRREDWDGVRWVTRLRAAIPGQSPAEMLALADGLAVLGCNDEAAALLEDVAAYPGTSFDASRALRARARGLLAPFN